MQVDMHFHATAVLARAAGFSQSEALTIGTAAQYVDDAQDGREILVGQKPFSPLSTANDFGRYLKSKEPEVWRKVYLPFHFPPPGPVRSASDPFITQPGGPMVDSLLADAAQDAGPSRLYRLVRLGVALHTVADTWSHQGFSGRWHDENDVIDTQCIGAAQSLLQAIDQAKRDLLDMALVAGPMKVAHFQAGFLPDYPFQEWRARFADLGQGIRELHLVNQEQYLQACLFMHQSLCAWPQGPSEPALPWSAIEPDIKTCLAHAGTDRQARCQVWRQTFGHMFPDTSGMPAYDPHQWEIEALGRQFKQTPFSDQAEELGSRPSYHGSTDFQQSAWVQFHRAAARQRAWLATQVNV